MVETGFGCTIEGYGEGEFDLIDGVFKLPQEVNTIIISSGNVNGMVDEHYRPTGTTPKTAGALPSGAEMFEYGASWELEP